MVDTVGMGYTERRKINELIVSEKVSYRDGFKQMIESIHRPFNEMEALVRKGDLISSLSRRITLQGGLEKEEEFWRLTQGRVQLSRKNENPRRRTSLPFQYFLDTL